MKKTILSVAIICCSIIAYAFGDQETRSLKSFDGVKISSGIEATLIQGSENKINIEVEGIELDKIETSVENGTLKVKIDEKWWKMGWNKKRKVIVEVYFSEELEEITATSGASIYAKETIESEELSLDASSGSKIDISIDNHSVDCDVSSGASIMLDGNTDHAKIDVSSGSTMKGLDLEVNEAILSASSGASIKINVNDKIKANASSGGSIKYDGNPSNTNINKSSGGSVRKM